MKNKTFKRKSKMKNIALILLKQFEKLDPDPFIRWQKLFVACLFIYCILQLAACGGSGSSSSGSGGASPKTHSIDIEGSPEFTKSVQSALSQYMPSCLVKIQSGPARGFAAIYLGNGITEVNTFRNIPELIGILAHENDHCVKPVQSTECETWVALEREANLAAARVLENLGYHGEAKWWRNQWGRHQGCGS